MGMHPWKKTTALAKPRVLFLAFFEWLLRDLGPAAHLPHVVLPDCSMDARRNNAGDASIKQAADSGSTRSAQAIILEMPQYQSSQSFDAIFWLMQMLHQ